MKHIGPCFISFYYLVERTCSRIDIIEITLVADYLQTVLPHFPPTHNPVVPDYHSHIADPIQVVLNFYMHPR